MFEAVDVITLIKNGAYDELNESVGEALTKRPDVRCFEFKGDLFDVLT